MDASSKKTNVIVMFFLETGPNKPFLHCAFVIQFRLLTTFLITKFVDLKCSPVITHSANLINLVSLGDYLNSHRAGIFKQSMRARNRGGIGLSYRPAMLHRLAEFIPWNRFLGSIHV
jgi:hypothetical protein